MDDVYQTAKAVFWDHLQINDEAILDDLAKRTQIVHTPKGTTLFREGFPIRDCYTLLSGIVRLYYTLSGVDYTEALFSERGSVVYPSFFLEKNAPANASVMTVTDCDLLYVPAANVIAIRDKYPDFYKIQLELVMRFQTRSLAVKRNLSNLMPTDRYISFVEHFPELADRVPQKYIASFLSMTPVSLSRIRSKLKEKENLSV